MNLCSKIKSCGFIGIEGRLVYVEVDISNGLPSFDIVGLPDTSVKEAKDRVRSSIVNSGFIFPKRRITINLAPANFKKAGSSYDLPIAIAVLSATGLIDCNLNNELLDDYILIAELPLDCKIRNVNGILCIASEAKKNNIRHIVVPECNFREASIIASIIDDIDVIPANTLSDIAMHLNGKKTIEYFDKENSIDQVVKAETEINSKCCCDMADIKGQENVKRALEISAAGGHNLIMIGSPGSGKTMLAKTFPSILPDMTTEESIEVTKIYSIAGLLNSTLVRNRPFRNPHHTVSAAGLIGGGSVPRPGELSLSHHGVLFLDELPEFRRDVLEMMRQPLEDGKVTISRINSTVTYPCKINFIASMNPCRCGYFGHPTKICSCNRLGIDKYLSRISGPLLDRIDLHIEVMPVNFDSLSKRRCGEDSATIRCRVNRARKLQIERYKDYNVLSNSELNGNMIEKFCSIDSQTKSLLKASFERMNLSARAYTRILKVARTIADLANSENINVDHIAEAIQYRSLDRKIWH